MNRDLIELLATFNESGVRYLIVGGYAVSLHAEPRATKDIDILIKADAENASHVFSALARFGAPLQGITVLDFAEPGPFFRMGRAPYLVDIMTEVPGVDFEAAWSRRVEHAIDQSSDVKVMFLSRDDLIAAKLASGRPQDLADVEALRKHR